MTYIVKELLLLISFIIHGSTAQRNVSMEFSVVFLLRLINPCWQCERVNIDTYIPQPLKNVGVYIMNQSWENI